MCNERGREGTHANTARRHQMVGVVYMMPRMCVYNNFQSGRAGELRAHSARAASDGAGVIVVSLLAFMNAASLKNCAASGCRSLNVLAALCTFSDSSDRGAQRTGASASGSENIRRGVTEQRKRGHRSGACLPGGA